MSILYNDCVSHQLTHFCDLIAEKETQALLVILVQALEGNLHWCKTGITVQSSDPTVPKTTDRQTDCARHKLNKHSMNAFPFEI